MMRAAFVMLVVGCGAGSPPPPAPVQPRVDEQAVAAERAAEAERAAKAEQARRDELAAAHRERLDEQATALAARCEDPAGAAAKRCVPSCYPREAVDARAGKKVSRPAEIVHLVCARDTTAGPFLVVGELAGGDVRARRGRMPKPHRKGSWQATVEAAVATALEPELARGDVVRVTGAWKSRVVPGSRERMRCVTVSHYAAATRGALDACGGRGAVACEAAGNAAALGANLVHYRLAEAKRFHKAGKHSECQQAAFEALAVARGLPRWRQYMALNTDQWKAFPRYRTRFAGLVDEDTLFANAIALGTEAHDVYVACGGAANPTTTAAQEQAFHSCQ